MFKNMYPLMAENDGEGNDLRGDDVIEPSTINDDEATPEDAVAEAMGEDKEEQARGKDGKFTKREREVPDHVPKARFDDAVGKERAAREAAERRADEAEARVRQEEKSIDLTKMEEAVEKLELQHSKLLLDGESEKAAAVMKEIRQAVRYMAKMENDASSSQATAQAVEQVRMESAIAKLESDYPTFNTDSEEYDQDLVDLVLAERTRLMQTERLTQSKALLKAASKIMAKLSPSSKDSGKGLAAAKGADRKADQVNRNLDTSKRQPASMRSGGKDSDKGGEPSSIANMTMAEFSALPESTKAKMRGDVL